MNIRQLRPPIIAALALGLLVVVLAAIVIGQEIKKSQLAYSISAQRESISAMSKDLSAYRKLEKNYTDLSSNVGSDTTEPSWSKQMPFMINQIMGIMQTRKLRMETLRPEQVETKDGISRFPLHVSFRGSIGDIARVANDIEGTLPILYIEELNIRPEGDKSDLLQADMTLSSFVMLDKDASGGDK